MPASSSPPDPDGSPLSEADRRALVRFLEQSLDHGFRLAIVEAAGHADREAILASVTPTIGAGLGLVDAAELAGPVENLWLALKNTLAAEPPRCLALWNLESACPDWTGQLNVQRDLFVRDVAVPWLLFIHPASRVPLMRAAPDFCDFAVLWLRDERPPREKAAYEFLPGQEDVRTDFDSSSGDPLLWRALNATDEARFDEARDALAQFDLRAEHDVFDRTLRLIIGARMERTQGHLAVAEALVRDAGNTLAQQPATIDFQALRKLADAELAVCFHEAGRFEEAAMLMRKNLLAEQAVDPESIAYARALHNLAGVLVRQGLNSEAEGLLRDSLAIQARAAAQGTLGYGASLTQLAAVLGLQGKHADAEQIYLESLRTKETAAGSEHPSLGSSLYGLSGALAAQGRDVEAERALRAALAIFEKTLGREHPEYARCLITLAGLIARQGRASEAESILRDSITVLEASLGHEHPDTIWALRGLSNNLAIQGRTAETEMLLRETLHRIGRSRGRGHPEYGRSSQALAHILSVQGKYHEAELLLYEVKELYESNLGPDHPHLGPVLSKLALLEAEQGRTLKAIRLLERALEIGRATLGDDAEEVRSMESLLKQLQRRRIRRRS